MISPATCTDLGMEYKVCTVCEELVEFVLEPATGHSFSEWAVSKESTCTNAGEESRKCEKCNLVEKHETEKLSHNFVEGNCQGCGAILGDVNIDNELDIRDLVNLKEILLSVSANYDFLCDINIGGEVNAGDMVDLKKILFARF